MYGRPIRTCLDLLRIPQPKPKVEMEESNKQPRSFERKQLVYAKVYANNKWTWEPGEVLEKVGHVMYNVWVNDRKLIRSHINQLRQRFPAHEKSGPSPTKDTHLPLSILLDEWDLPFQTETTPNPEPEVEPMLQSPAQRSSVHVPSSLSSDQSSASSSSSSTSTSADFESANDSTPALRRSTRTRRPPQSFLPYRRY
ncbi:uncharacterized protein LOC129742077 [Uranotaenia lowii]|uniref:uncharacterized protein LOC129742077 n=1 Tax=Uranotaenia lowii TaxID=190385 RepID=UPI002479217F|nr:uncharacterized protein LOC129742077 [Uranotaenia lowii]